MKMVFFISSLQSGGAENVLSRLANYMHNQSHDVHIVTLQSPAAKNFYPLEDGITQHHLNLETDPQSGFFQRILYMLKRTKHLRSILKTLAPDIAISFVEMMNINVLMATTGLKTPVIVAERTNPYFYRIPKLYNFLRSLFYKRAKIITVQTSAAATYFKSFTNVKIIPNPVRKPAATKQDTDKTVQSLISVGRLCEKKGFRELIDAFDQLQPSYPDLQLTIYGEGYDRQTLEGMIQAKDLSQKIFLPGRIQDIDAALIQHDLFVFPSHYEGFPNALCEAMAVGLPVIASNCSGNIDIMEDHVNGRLFPVGDRKALTALMQELIEDPQQRSKLAQNAQKISEHYNENKILGLWDDLIAAATTQHKR